MISRSPTIGLPHKALKQRSHTLPMRVAQVQQVEALHQLHRLLLQLLQPRSAMVARCCCVVWCDAHRCRLCVPRRSRCASCMRTNSWRHAMSLCAHLRSDWRGG